MVGGLGQEDQSYVDFHTSDLELRVVPENTLHMQS